MCLYFGLPISGERHIVWMDGWVIGDFVALFLSLACLWFIVKFGMCLHKVDFNMLLNVYRQIFVFHDLEMHVN